MTGGIVLGIGLCFHDHAPEQAAVVLALHQPASHQIRPDLLRWTAEEGERQGWKIVSNGLGSCSTDFRLDEVEARGMNPLIFTYWKPSE